MAKPVRFPQSGTTMHRPCAVGCEVRGTCYAPSGRCDCPFGWTGPSCDNFTEYQPPKRSRCFAQDKAKHQCGEVGAGRTRARVHGRGRTCAAQPVGMLAVATGAVLVRCWLSFSGRHGRRRAAGTVQCSGGVAWRGRRRSNASAPTAGPQRALQASAERGSQWCAWATVAAGGTACRRVPISSLGIQGLSQDPKP